MGVDYSTPKHRWTFSVVGDYMDLFLRTTDRKEALKRAHEVWGELGIPASDITIVSFDHEPCPQYPPECCQSCGAPFNNADTPPDGLCASCRA